MSPRFGDKNALKKWTPTLKVSKMSFTAIFSEFIFCFPHLTVVLLNSVPNLYLDLTTCYLVVRGPVPVSGNECHERKIMSI